MSDKIHSSWGVGNKANSKAFETGKLDDGTPYELIFGEYPHSRRDNDIYARFANKMGADQESIVGFDGHRIQVRIELRTMNYLKTSSLSGDEVRKGGEWRIWFNDHHVYTAFTRDPLEALLTIRQKLSELMDLPVSLWRGASPSGRKIYYRSTPAIITGWIPEEGCILLIPDGVDTFPIPVWREEGEKEEIIKDDILSPHIWWWRKGD